MSAHRFETELFLWEGDASSWVFAALPEDVADEVEAQAGPPRGFGAVRVEVTLGGTTWRTSVFPSKSAGTYLLPVKRPVLRAEGAAPGDRVRIGLTVVGGAEAG